MQNRGSENAVFGTRFLFGGKYVIFNKRYVLCWLLVWYKDEWGDAVTALQTRYGEQVKMVVLLLLTMQI